ncbi:MAG: FAD-dependent oxidoreductase, partial [Bdellovibrionales bacterium]|nr:FAD-dependent oxidoreductase [Bdellovibrionales bacterium]
MEDKSPQLSIGVIGSGIAGVSAAYYLGKEHRVTLFESRERLGGHTHTVTVEDPSAGSVPVDTGFIVCNDRTYPHFHSFLEELRVPIRSGDMSFGYYDENSNFGYAPTGVSGLVPQWSHLVNRSYLKLWMTLPRFNKRALRNLHSGSLTGLTLREYVERENVSAEFVQLFLVPMGAAIWSSADEKLLETPAETFFGFFKNHGLLTLFDRPQWQTVVGGSHQYLKAFEREFSGKIRLNSRVSSVKRPMGKVEISTDQGSCEEFDLVVFACHADQVLPILEDATEIERTLFAPWKYHSNRTVLHTDKSYL